MLSSLVGKENCNGMGYCWMCAVAVLSVRRLSSRAISHRLGCSDAGADCGLPVDGLGASPELFEGVVVAGFIVEEMDHDVAVVLQDPSAGGVAFDADALFAELIGERAIDFFGYGVQLAAAGARGDEEEIEDGGELAKIEQDDVLPAVIVSNPGGGQGHLETSLARLASKGRAGLWYCQTWFSRENDAKLAGIRFVRSTHFIVSRGAR